MSFDTNDIIEKIKYDPNSVKKDYDGRTDIYYAKVSYRYAYIKRIVCVLLVLSVIALLLSGSLSYNKLYYLVKDVRLAGEYVGSVHDTISYNIGSSQSFALYRGGLAVASRERLELFSASGKELYSASHSLGNPVLIPSSRYILLYDAGGNRWALYNSFSSLRDGALDERIYGADIADNGTFALITSSEDHHSTVKVYGVDGTRHEYNFSSGRVSAVALSDNGKKMAVALSGASGNALESEVRIYKLGSNDFDKAQLTFSGIPYELRFLENGSVCAVGACGVNVFSEKMRLLGEYLSDTEIYLYSFGEDNIAIAHLSYDASSTRLVIVNKHGRTERALDSRERVLGMELCDGYLFLRKTGAIERVNILFGDIDKRTLDAADYEILACERDTVLLCTGSYAKFLTFE